MFRLWCKLFDDSNHLLKDMVVENDDAATNRTRKIFDGIHSACYAFDLSEPIWLAKLSFLHEIVIPSFRSDACTYTELNDTHNSNKTVFSNLTIDHRLIGLSHTFK